MKRVLRSVAALAMVLVSAGALAAEKVWVTSANSKLMADSAASAKVVATLPLGTELKVLSTKDKWYEVSASTGERGWIYRGKVSETQPEASGGGLFGALGTSSIEVSSADTSRSIRGLSPEAEQYAHDAKTPAEYKMAVDQVMALTQTDAELDRFLKEGKIGEYAQ